jgi:hypothetical protein
MISGWRRRRRTGPPFCQIRGIRKACLVIADHLKGDASREFFSRWQASMPLDPTVINYPLDEAPATEWTSALEAILLDDPGSPLPS